MLVILIYKILNGRIVYIALCHWFTTSQWVLETRQHIDKVKIAESYLLHMVRLSIINQI